MINLGPVRSWIHRRNSVSTSRRAFAWTKFCSIFACLSVFSVSQGQTTLNSSAEAINPFNEFMSPSGGVNLFSGNVAFIHHLHTLQGRNGFDLPIDFKYSGNVQLNVLARNDKAPTDWVGLGWRFGFGYIRCDPNQTVTLKDDRCHYVSPNGVSQEIVPSGAGYQLEKDPYWKIDTTLSSDGERILGWTLTDVQGRKYGYGDFTEPNVQRKATRYTFAWTGAEHDSANYVGEGFAGTPHLFPVQWDLMAQEDESGQRIVFEYEQKLEAVKKGSWTSPVSYTKASYLKSITVPGGGEADFLRQAKPAGEAYDPKDFYPEPDAFMEPLEEDYLDRVEIKNMNGEKTREYRLVYDVRSFVEKAGYTKRFLKEIKEYGADGIYVGSHRFTYAVDRPDSSGYPLGAMTDMENPLCGKVHFDYSKVEIKETRRIVQGKDLRTFGSGFVPYSDRLPDGREYVIIDNGAKEKIRTRHDFFIFVNEDGIWKQKKVKGTNGRELGDDLGLEHDLITQVIPGEGFFMVIKGSGSNSKLSLFEWDGEDWDSTNFYQKSQPGNWMGNASGRMAVIFDLHSPGELTGTPRDIASFSYSKEGGLWKEIAIDTIYGYSYSSSRLVGNQFLLRTRDGNPGTLFRDHSLHLYAWNGNSWIKSKTVSINRNDGWGLGEGYVGGVSVFTAPAGVAHFYTAASALNWNGYQWKVSPNKTLKGFEVDAVTGGFLQSHFEGGDVYLGQGFYTTQYGKKNLLATFEWDGEGWEKVFSKNMVPNEDLNPTSNLGWQGNAYGSHLIALYPRLTWKFISIPVPRPYFWGIRIAHVHVPYWGFWNPADQNAKGLALSKDAERWATKDFGSFGYPETEKKVQMGEDFFLHDRHPSNGQVWNGSQWLQQDFSRALGKDAIYPLGPNLAGEKQDSSINLIRKLQNDLVGSLFSFVVSKKTVYDPVRDQTSEYAYSYQEDGGRYDIRAGTAKFHHVTLKLPDHGRREFFFHNGSFDSADGLSATETSQTYELSGNLFLEKGFDQADKEISRKRHTYEVFHLTGWPDAVRTIRLRNTESFLDKMKTAVAQEYVDSTGLVKKKEETGSRMRKRITTYMRAYEVPEYQAAMGPGPGGRYMLSQVAEKKVYEGSEALANLRQSVVTTWKLWATLPGTAPLPLQSWAWNAGSRAPPAYRAFDHHTLSANTSPWKLLSTVDRRDSSGRVVQSSDPLGTAQCAIYGHQGHFLIATASHARCSELAVLTGDFDDKQGGLLDAANGWSRNQAIDSTDRPHFGKATLHIPVGAAGPEKILSAAAAGRDYEFSAWVYPIAVSPSSPIALHVFKTSGAEILAAQAGFGSLQPGATGGWQRIKRILPKDSLGTGTLRILIGAQGTAEYYADDIRFYPVGALVTTRYLDPRFYQSVSEVSPSGSAQYSEFDGAARLLKTFAEDGQGKKVLRSELEYHLDGCGYQFEAQGTLKKLAVSAGFIPFQKTVRDYGDLWVEPVLEKALIRFEPENPYEDVEVRINGGAWGPPCCRGSNSLEVDLASTATVVEVRAGAGQPYRVSLRKSTDCWTLKGGKISAGGGGMPAPFSYGSETWVAYLSDQDGNRLYVKRWDAGTQSWQQVGGAISASAASSPILRVMQGTPYLAYLDEVTIGTGDTARTESRAVVKRWNGSSWLPLQGDGIVSKGETKDISFEASTSFLWLAFVGDRLAEEGGTEGGSPAYIRKWNGTQWVAEGDFIPLPDHPPGPGEEFHGDSVADGRLSEGDASHTTLAINSTGSPIVGYLGSVKMLNPDADSSRFSQSPAFFIMKKLDTITFPNNFKAIFWGDVVPGTGDGGDQLTLTPLGDVLPVPGTDKVQVGFVGSILYAAFTTVPLSPIPGSPDSSFSESGQRVLEVRKYQPGLTYTDGSHWFPLVAGTTQEQNMVTPMDDGGDFWFTGQAGFPALAYVNAYNRDRVTVVFHDGTRWKPIGNPAFLPVDAGAGEGRLSVTVGGSTGFVAFRQGGENGETRTKGVSLATYSGSCPDLTLTQLEVRDAGQVLPMDWSFRSHLLYLQGGIRENADTAEIRIVPGAVAQVAGIAIVPSAGPSQVWNSGQTLPTGFKVPLAPGSNTVEVELVSSDLKHRNRYKIALRRLPPQTVTGTVSLEVPSSPAFDVAKPGTYKVVVPANKTSFTLGTDIAGARSIFVNGTPVAPQSSYTVPLVPGTNVISVVVIDYNHVRWQYDIQVDRGVPSQPVTPLLESVTANVHGSYTATFGYQNPNAASLEIPAGNENGMRYQGRSGEYLGQSQTFSPGTVHGAFTVEFDGSPLTWILQGQSVTATAGVQAPLVKVEMRDNGLEDPNVSKPQIRLTNLSPSTILGLKISLWVSREEEQSREVKVDTFKLVPSGVTVAITSHPQNDDLLRIDLNYPASLSIPPGWTTGEDGPQVGVHWLGYWPGIWDRTNDWSWYGIGRAYTPTSNVAVYDGGGRLLAGREPGPDGAAQPLPLTQANVFSFDETWPWRIAPGNFSLNTTRHTQGVAGLQLDTSGSFSVFNSPMKTTDISGETTTLKVDYYMPNGQPNPSYKGQIQLSINCLSVGINNQFIQSLPLTGLPNGQFSTLTFTLPTAILTLLQENHRDFQFKFDLNINQGSEQPVLDNMRFAP